MRIGATPAKLVGIVRAIDEEAALAEAIERYNLRLHLSQSFRLAQSPDCMCFNASTIVCEQDAHKSSTAAAGVGRTMVTAAFAHRPSAIVIKISLVRRSLMVSSSYWKRR